MSDVNDLASSLFGTSRAEVASGGTSTLYGTAATDSSGGSVSVRMGADTLRADGQAGTSVLVPTTTDVRAGETVIVTVVDGHPVVTGVVGSGDRLRTDVDAAAGVADLAKQNVTKAQADIDQFKKDAEATYSTKTETDEKTDAVKETIEATYLKKDDASTTYATKTELTKSADGIKAEVAEEYVTKADASETYVGKSRFEQLATSIKSLVRGEGTYTDPDGVSATSGIYSLITQTRDSVTALFGDYTKTADLASTQAVKDAKKAGTDAQATADAAKSAAATAQGTANGAKSTADSLATLIREDADGITVGKSADGKTYATGRTRMDADSFDVLDKAGKVLSSFGASLVRLGTNAAAILLAGILRVEALQTHPATAGGSKQTIDTGRISVPVHAEVGTPWSAIELAGRNDTSGAATTALRAEFSVDGRDGSIQPYVYVDCGMTVDGTLLMSDKASTLGTRKGLRITQGSKVCHGHGTAWVTLFESWAEFKQATGCYDSGLPTLVTMNGDWGEFDGSLSDCEIHGGDAVFVMARTTDGPHTLYSSNSVRINWICIW